MSSKVDKVLWFTGFDTIGIALTTDEITGEKKARIGHVQGIHEELDQNHLRDYGTSMSVEQVAEILSHLKSSSHE